jgi:hypothetical protein
MSDTIIGLDQPEEEMLAYEISDEALETAAGTRSEKAGNYELWYCVALNLRPDPERMLFGTNPIRFRELSNCSLSSGVCSGGRGASRGAGLVRWSMVFSRM